MIRKSYVIPYHLNHVPSLKPTMPHVYMFNNHYSHSFSTIKQLVEEARKDFPSLTDEDIQFRTYRTTGYMDGMLGCEFQVPEGCLIPKDYIEASKLPSY